MSWSLGRLVIWRLGDRQKDFADLIYFVVADRPADGQADRPPGKPDSHRQGKGGWNKRFDRLLAMNRHWIMNAGSNSIAIEMSECLITVYNLNHKQMV